MPLSKSLEQKIDRLRPLVRDRLESLPSCRGLFTALGHDPEETLGSQYLLSATLLQEREHCRGENAAFTRPGSPVIHFCRTFVRLPEEQAAVILIHEALHTAGLPEWPANPYAMASAEINDLVASSCRL